MFAYGWRRSAYGSDGAVSQPGWAAKQPTRLRKLTPPLPEPASGACGLSSAVPLSSAIHSNLDLRSLPSPLPSVTVLSSSPSRSFISTRPHASLLPIPPPLEQASAAHLLFSSSSIATNTMLGSPLHPASLVDPSLHSPALMELIDIEMGRSLIGEYTLSYILSIR